MDIQSILNLALGFGMAVIGWFARELWSAVKELKADLAHLREEIPKRYTPKDDLYKLIERIDQQLQRVLDRLDDKADKK